MNPDDHHDRLVDMLLKELVGNESPPRVLDQVLARLNALPPKSVLLSLPPAARRPPPRIIPSKNRTWAAIAAVLLVLIALPALLHHQSLLRSKTPMVIKTTGSVSPASGPLRPGAVLETGPNSSATLAWPDGTLVRIDPKTRVEITQVSFWDRSKSLSLIDGKLQADVAPQPNGSPMTLMTDHALTQVIGTGFTLTRSDTSTRLEVSEGRVHFAPVGSHTPLLVGKDTFAETVLGAAPRFGSIQPAPTHGILGFTLMNADTDQAISDSMLTDGQTISLSSLPTPRISLRADYAGERPFHVTFHVSRLDGADTGIPKMQPQHFPPYFATGDYSSVKRPADSRAWVPKPGDYQISAFPSFRNNDVITTGESRSLRFTISR